MKMDYNDDEFNSLNFLEYELNGAGSPLQLSSMQLQVPMYEENYGGYGDSSQSLPQIPMQDQSVFSSTDPPRLSPHHHQYQPMSSLAFEASAMQLDVPSSVTPSYNSFEQPVAVINGEYSNSMGSPGAQLERESFYAREQPSTSQAQQPMQVDMQSHHRQSQHVHVQQQARVVHAVPQQQQQQPQVQVQQQQQQRTVYVQQHVQHQTPPSQPTRHRPIQPKSSKKKTTMQPGSVGAVIQSAHQTHQSITNNGGASDQKAFRMSATQLEEVNRLNTQIANLKNQQSLYTAVDNSREIADLEAKISLIFFEALSGQQQQVGSQVIEQLAQMSQQPQQPPPPKPSRNRRSQPAQQVQHQQHHQPQAQQHQRFEAQPTSPQFTQILVSNAQPSTSQGTMYVTSVDYSQAQPTQSQGIPVVISQPIQGQVQQVQVVNQMPSGGGQRPVINRRVNNVQANYQVQTSRGQQVYVQQVPQPSIQVSGQGPIQTQNSPMGGMHVIRANQPIRVLNKQAPPAQRQVLVQPQQMMMNSPLPPDRPTTSSPAPIVMHQHHQKPVIVHQPQPVVQLPPPPTPAQVARRMQEKRKERLESLRSGLDRLVVGDPETERPFSDARDLLLRLLPYHHFSEPEIKSEEFEQFDINYVRQLINLQDRKKRLENRLQSTLFKESMSARDKEETNLLIFLDTEYEKRQLESEKALVNDMTREEFVRNSSIVALAKEGISLPGPSIDPPKHSFHNTYEYHPFVEERKIISPYRSPSPFKSPASSRRSSPIKSPSFRSPQMRQRSSNSMSSSASMPPPTPPPLPVRPDNGRMVASKGLKTPKVEIRPSPQKEIKPEIHFKAKIKKEPTPTPQWVPPVHEDPPSPVAVLPLKKHFLSRARRAIPPEMRSPPAQQAAEAVQQPSLDESDGSCSPELGMDDGFMQPPAPIVAKENPPKLPSPAVVNQKVPVVNKFCSLPPAVAVKSEEQEIDYNLTHITFKPQVPRPQKVQVPSKPTPSKMPPSEEIKKLKHKHHEENLEKPLVPIVTPKLEEEKPRLTLKLKLGNLNLSRTLETGDDEKMKELEEHRRRKKEKKKKKAKDREERREKRLHKRLIGEVSGEQEELIVTPSAGPRLKIKFNRSRTTTPALMSTPEVSRPSSSAGILADVDTPVVPPMKIPKLKIRFGAPSVVSAEKSEANVVAIISPTLPSVNHAGSLPAIDFSDDDDEAERLRNSTDDALRSCGLTGLNMRVLPSNAPLLPWSSNP